MLARRWSLLVVLTCSYGLGAFGMLGVSPLSPALMQGFGLSRLDVAFIVPSVYVGGLLFSLPGGHDGAGRLRVAAAARAGPATPGCPAWPRRAHGLVVDAASRAARTLRRRGRARHGAVGRARLPADLQRPGARLHARRRRRADRRLADRRRRRAPGARYRERSLVVGSPPAVARAHVRPRHRHLPRLRLAADGRSARP